MTRRVLEHVKRHHMLEKGDRIVVGVSGGADSMSLLLFLMSVREEYELTLVVVHVNHGIRGAAADADEKYVRDFCAERGVACECVHADVPTIVRNTGMTEEEAGRMLRYNAFRRICELYSCNKIAVAHNREDNAETVLFNMFRGSGISGIRGISPVREEDGITIIRPLLSTSRAEIEDYLNELQVRYVSDATNAETEYSRNRIRHKVLPYVSEEINSGAVQHITELAEQAGEIEQLIDELVAREIDRLSERDLLRYRCKDAVRVDIAYLRGMNGLLRRSLLRRLLGEMAGRLKDIEQTHIRILEDLSEGPTGRSADLPYGLRAEREYGWLVIKRRKADAAELYIECTVPGEYKLPDGRVLVLRTEPYNEKMTVPKNDFTKWFDYARINSNICIRTRKEGDRLMIAAGGGRDGLCNKSLKSYMIDSKISREERDRIPVLAEGDHVMWLIGYRRDDAYPVTAETDTVLIAEIK